MSESDPIDTADNPSWKAVAEAIWKEPKVLAPLVLLAMWAVGGYLSRGLQVVVVVGFIVALFGGVVWLSYNTITFLIGSPAVVGGYIGISIAAAIVLTVIGYVADERGWLEFEDDHL